MKLVLTAAAISAGLGAGIGVVSTTNFRPVISQLAYSLASGIILGSNVGSYLSGLTPTDVESRVKASRYASNVIADPKSVDDE